MSGDEEEEWGRRRRRIAGDPVTAALSADLLALILDRVAAARDRKAWRLVSRGFLRAEALHRRALRPLRRDALPRLLRRFPALELLDLSACPALDDASLAAAALGGAGRRLRSVCLARASGVGWRGLEAAAVADAAGLRELLLDKCLGVTDVGLAKVAVGCPALDRLSVKWCLEISDIGIDLLAKKCPDLRSLDISYIKVTNESLRSISSLRKLEDLAMVGCYFIDDDGMRILSRGCNSFQSIDVSRCENVSSGGLASLLEGHHLLRSINARDCVSELTSCFLSKLSVISNTLNILKLDGFQLSVSALKIIGMSCKNLVEIGLGKCKGVTDEGISELVANCAELRTINLVCCHLLTDDALFSIANNCKKVECLGLESCSLITEKGLDQLTICCSSVKELDLTDCNVNDAGLKCMSRCSELTALKLGLCASISDEGLAYIGSNCEKLQELDLYRCTAVTDNGLAAIAAGCKSLKRLNLCYCTQISDTGMKHLSCLEELTDLELRGLVRVTSSGITSLAMGCKSLVKLELKRCYSVDDAGLWALARYSENLRQLTISYCPVTGLGLCNLLGTLRCLQDVKLVHLSWVSIEGFELALRASCGRLKKLKLLSGLQEVLSPELLQMLQSRGCRIRWVDKPLVFKG
ncbi:F-box/LRR-repeat protein 3-like isoform X1 [Ananas comosus]|uniref:F-box/LRR-repeat protein 3-like isoform X1 n=2 Tax=Ananas comosus TaxID=4615 RepID=A0A6P5G076_ANACO|nr:F-box/LRR-repeat protein 3-like isoform X1 [Ananas comosus]